MSLEHVKRFYHREQGYTVTITGRRPTMDGDIPVDRLVLSNGAELDEPSFARLFDEYDTSMQGETYNHRERGYVVQVIARKALNIDGLTTTILVLSNGEEVEEKNFPALFEKYEIGKREPDRKESFSG